MLQGKECFETEGLGSLRLVERPLTRRRIARATVLVIRGKADPSEAAELAASFILRLGLFSAEVGKGFRVTQDIAREIVDTTSQPLSNSAREFV